MIAVAERLLGSWALLRWEISYPDGRPVSLPFGDDAVGCLMYAADGWMSATMCRQQRASAAASEYLTYCGPWHVEGDVVIHDVRYSLSPVLLGTRQERRAVFLGATLQLAAAESDSQGRQRDHRILWCRQRSEAVKA